MATRREAHGFEHVGQMARRVEYLIGGRIRDRKKIQAASDAIDRLRRKVPRWHSVEEIRRWRDHR